MFSSSSPASTKSPPLYRQIEAQLRARIESGELQPGDRIPSVNDLRRHFGGVNHLTVRQALKHLNRDGLIRAEQGRGTFVQRRFRRTGRIALILPDLTDSSCLRIVCGAQNILSEAGFKTLILDSRLTRSEEVDAYASLDQLSVDGALIFPIDGGGTGFGNMTQSSADMPPTTVHLPKEHLGEEAAQMLLALLEGQTLPSLPPLRVRLLIREIT